jgi:hypothetical protein
VEKITPATATINTRAGAGKAGRARLAAVPALALLLCLTLSTHAQVSTQSYLRDKPADAESEDPRVPGIIARAEEHFRLGQVNLKDQKRQAAREEFDKAVDIVLESGVDLRENKALKKYYDGLVERVYQIELHSGAAERSNGETYQQVARGGGVPQPDSAESGFVEQKFEPSPLDDLRTLALTKEDLRKPPTDSAKRVCAGVNIDNLELRGFRLGMSQAEVKARIPDLVTTRPNGLGESRSFTLVRANKYLSRNATLKGVLSISLRYLDGRVTSVSMFYDDSLKWESSAEFAGQVAASLSLPTEWARFDDDSDDEQMRVLRCERFALVAGLSRVSYRLLPAAHLFDLTAINTVNRRAVDEAERKRRAEEQRKRSFKP